MDSSGDLDVGPMKTTAIETPLVAIELETRNASGSHDPSADRYYANGKRITREESAAIKRAAVRLGAENGWQSGGAWTFHRWAHVPAELEAGLLKGGSAR